MESQPQHPEFRNDPENSHHLMVHNHTENIKKLNKIIPTFP